MRRNSVSTAPPRRLSKVGAVCGVVGFGLNKLKTREILSKRQLMVVFFVGSEPAAPSPNGRACTDSGAARRTDGATMINFLWLLELRFHKLGIPCPRGQE